MNNNKRTPSSNLREEAQKGRLPALVGRGDEMQRLNRLLGRRTNNNVLIVGQSGIGKTALIWGWARHMSERAGYEQYALLQLDTEHLYDLESDAGLDERYAEAFEHMPSCVLFVDDFGREVYKNLALAQRIHRLYKPLLTRPNVHVVFTLQPHEYAWLEREYPAFVYAFETLTLKQQSTYEY